MKFPEEQCVSFPNEQGKAEWYVKREIERLSR